MIAVPFLDFCKLDVDANVILSGNDFIIMVFVVGGARTCVSSSDIVSFYVLFICTF